MDGKVMLVKRHNFNTKRKEWALVSVKDSSKVLKWFGVGRPSEGDVAREEARVEYFKHKKGG